MRLLTLACLLLASCAVPNKQVRNQLTEAPKQPPVAPVVADLDAAIRESSSTSAKLEAKVASISNSAEGVKRKLSDATEEVQRLKAQKQASEAEIDDLLDKLTDATSVVDSLMADLTDARQTAEAQRVARETVEGKLKTAIAVAASKDAEVAQLRSQMLDAKASIENLQQANDVLLKNLSKAEKRAASGTLAKYAVIAVFIVLTLALALFLASKLGFLPSFKIF